MTQLLFQDSEVNYRTHGKGYKNTLKQKRV